MKRVEEFEQIKQEFQKIQEAFKQQTDTLNTFTTNAEQTIEGLNPQMEKIHTFFQEINEGMDGKTPLEEQKNVLYENIKNIQEKITESSNKQNELNEYYVKIFGDLDEETKTRKGGLRQEIEAGNQIIETRNKKFDDYKRTQEQTIEALKQQINSLLPGATSTGLAKAFADEKKSFKGVMKGWSVGFILTITALVGFAVYRLEKVSSDLNTWQNILNFIVSGFPIFLPLFWLAISCAKRRSEYSMLKQEYAHKEAFATSYSSHKEQIDGLQKTDDNLSKTLLEKAVNIIAKNPTHVLTRKHSSDLPIEEITVLIKACKGNTEAIESILDRFLIPTKTKQEGLDKT